MSRCTKMVVLAMFCMMLGYVSGCTDPIKAPMTGTEDFVTYEAYPQVFVEKELSKYINVTGAEEFDRSQLGEDQPMSVTIPVRSLGDKDINLQYKYTFFDNQGRPIKPQMAWRYILVMPRNQVFLQGRAIDTVAADWRLDIRRAR